MGVPAERLVFATAFESLFCAEVRERLTPALVEELKSYGVDVHRSFNAAYPVEAWAKTAAACTRTLFPNHEPADGWFELGRLTIRGFQRTLVGGAMFKLLKLIGPARTLERSMRSYASSSNYSVIELKRLGPTHYEMSLNEQHTPPQFDAGIIHESLVALGATGRVTVLSHDASGFRLDIAW